MALGKRKPGHVCPMCSGHGFVFMPDEHGVRRQLDCGHSKCQTEREERIAQHVLDQLQEAVVQRVVVEVFRHLPPDIAKRGKT